MKSNQKNQLLFILTLFAGGILAGILGGFLLKGEQLNQLDHILSPVNESVDLYQTFLFQFSQQMVFICAILVLGTSLVGTYLISFLLFTRGFQIGLTCMMFFYTYELKGILGIILTLVPQVLLDMVPIVIMALASIEFSNHILYGWLKGIKLNIKNEMNRSLNHVIFSVLTAIISSYLKATLIIMLIRFFNHI